MRRFWIVACGALVLSACSDPPLAPKWDPTARVSAYDGDLNKHGIFVTPDHTIATTINKKMKREEPGAEIFKTQEPLYYHDEIVLTKGSYLAARHPFPKSNYYAVYAVQDSTEEDKTSWVPATGVVAWPPPAQEGGGKNAWFSMISEKFTEN